MRILVQYDRHFYERHSESFCQRFVYDAQGKEKVEYRSLPDGEAELLGLKPGRRGY